MKTSIVAATSLLALTLAGCGSAARTSAIATGKLDCPDRQGDLTRLSMAPDGKTCVYRIHDDAEVTLTLMPVTDGDAGATLARLETQLKAETTPPPGAPVAEAPDKTGTAADAAKASAEAKADAARAGPKAAEDQADAAKTGAAKVEWDDRTIEAKVNAKLREKGIDVEDGGSGGDSAHVDMPGIHINAEGDKADVHVGPIHIDANGETATVKSFKDVRMRGEAFSRTKRGVRAMFLYAGDDLGNGYKYVGYEAAGPRSGPLAVAVVRSKTSGGFHGDVYGDVKRLVRRNGGT